VAITSNSVFFLAGAESVLQVTLSRLAGYRRSLREANDAQRESGGEVWLMDENGGNQRKIEAAGTNYL
jgi:hypothetical protein